MRTLLFILLLCSSPVWAQTTDSLVLVGKDKVNYELEINSSKATEAGNIFQAYFESICGMHIAISNHKTNKKPLLVFSDSKDASIVNNGYEIKTEGRNIIISANDSSGFSNAVFYILENRLGCRYYTPEAIVIPKRKDIRMAPVNIRQIPSFSFRINYNGCAFDKAFAQWHGLHNKPQGKATVSFDISDNWGLWVHTLHHLIPPETYFPTHPEYFALRNGVRIPDQLCLSNPEVLKIVTSALQAEMKKNPDAKYWSVSQMDNFNYCQCDRCRAIDSLNESPSGSIITFVNAVAQAFPDKVISTLAYQYSRKAPKIVKPLPNVNIMLCSIESDRNKPIAADGSQDGFKHDLEQWGQLTHNILVWDYVINFSNIIGPFPNFHVLKPNLELFRDNNVSMLFEQGWPRNAGEFTELRTYLLAKLMWNPAINTDSVMQDFCKGFYGPGGKFVYDYIQLSTKNLLKSGRALTLYEPMSAHAEGFLSPKNIQNYVDLLQQALQKTKDDETYHHRIDMAMQPLRYAWLEVAKSLPFTENWIFQKDAQGNYAASPKARQLLNELCDLALANGPSLFHETKLKPQEYRERMTDYFNHGYQNHKAVGKTITFATPCSSKYAANGANSLIDGVCGTENYFCLWQGWNGDDLVATIDLGVLDTVHSVTLHALSDHMSWIFPAESVTVTGSSDGKQYRELGRFDYPEARSKATHGIIPYDVKFSKTERCRFLKIQVKNIGKIPDWRGVDGMAWLFVDEIIVR